ncbi:MAG: DNA cytosine methyltransferase [Brevundimonas sp.]|uniref:DNA cytosine methyltransferase n=1 Tax=Brevundimonas sp. TaxID=1871086 RepID=UPI003919EF30
MTRPLAIDLFCGLGGWTEGLLSEGWRVRGYDIEAHEYGDERYPAELVLADVMSLHGADLAEAELIVASPPCTEFSYMAMPWGRAKQIARALRGEDEFPEGYNGSRTVAELTALFNACFRLQREANEAAGRDIPMIVENVRGAVPWVGKAAWNHGSFYLWGDVPALMPEVVGARKLPGCGHGWKHPDDPRHTPGLDFTRLAGKAADGIKQAGLTGLRDNGKGSRWFQDGAAPSGSKSSARKAASAKIAKIPLALSSHIARVYHPGAIEVAA